MDWRDKDALAPKVAAQLIRTAFASLLVMAKIKSP